MVAVRWGLATSNHTPVPVEGCHEVKKGGVHDLMCSPRFELERAHSIGWQQVVETFAIGAREMRRLVS